MSNRPLREAARTVHRAGAQVVMAEPRANHTTLTIRNAHGALFRTVIPHSDQHHNGRGWHNARAKLRRALRLSPGETDGGRS